MIWHRRYAIQTAVCLNGNRDRPIAIGDFIRSNNFDDPEDQRWILNQVVTKGFVESDWFSTGEYGPPWRIDTPGYLDFLAWEQAETRKATAIYAEAMADLRRTIKK